MMTMGETTAEAPRPLFGTIENAIPSAVEQALPSRTNQVKVSYLLNSVGISTPKNRSPNPKRRAIWIIMLTAIKIALPMK